MSGPTFEADLGDVLATVARDGAAFVAHALPRDLRASLLDELAAVALERAPERVGVVRQQVDATTLRRPLRGFPIVADLRRDLVAAIRRDGTAIRGLATWWPDDVSLQRYRPGSTGISAHLDGRRFRRLVAVFTLAGRATFTVLAARGGPTLRRWTAGPGSLVLLRGPGLAGRRDGRPFHEVRGPLDGARSTLSFRMGR